MDKESPEIYLSSTCFKESNLLNLCDLLVTNGFDKIELSGNLDHIGQDKLIEIFDHYKNSISFNIHNYFPAAKIPFVLNLAHPETVGPSIEHCLEAIDLCSYLGKSYYSLHAGISFNPNPGDLGNEQYHLPSIGMSESRVILFEAIKEVAKYGKGKNVTLLLENNVVTKTNCPGLNNSRYHLSGLEEFRFLFPLFIRTNVGILVDTGHLKVSANTLNYDPIIMANKYAQYVKVVHLSENDGEDDQNLPLNKKSWFWNQLPWERVDYVSLEINGQSIDTLKQQIELVEYKFSEYFDGKNFRK